MGCVILYAVCKFTHNVKIYAVFCHEKTFIANLRCFVVKQILSKIYALLRGKISWSEMRLWKKMTNMRYEKNIQQFCPLPNLKHSKLCRLPNLKKNIQNCARSQTLNIQNCCGSQT